MNLELPMNDFDRIIIELSAKIKERPQEKHRIIMQTLKHIECPYIKRKLKEAFPYG